MPALIRCPSSARPPLCRAKSFGAAVALLCALGEASSFAAPVLRVKGHVELTLQTVQRRRGQTELAGKLEDASLQRALSDRSVRVFVHDDTDQLPERSSTSTDNDGIFRVRSRRCERRCTVSVQFAGDAYYAAATYGPQVVEPTKTGVESSPLVVVIVPPVPPSPRIYIYSLLATLGLVGLFTLVRARLQLSAGLSRNTAERKQPAPAADPSPAATAGGLRPARKHGLRRFDHGISGVVWDPTDECPLSGACLRIEGPNGDFAAETDSAGQFSKDDLPSGDYRVAVSHPGYITEAFQISLPHRGQLRAVRIDLVSIRVRILELYKEVALPLLPHPSLWARWTPRELLDHLHFQDPDLQDLTTVLERAYWSGTLPGHDLLARAEQRGQTRTAPSRTSRT